MRILHVTDCYLPRLGGIETQVHDLAQRQLAAGHDVLVATATPRARHDRTRRELIDGVSVHRITVDLPFELPVHPRPGQELSALLRAERPDVVHLHVGLVSVFAQGAAPAVVASGTATVITVHSLWGSATPAFRGLDRVLRWSRWPVLWSAVSEVAAAPLIQISGGRLDVHILPNGIDVDRWRTEPAPRAGGEVLAVAAMRLARRKRPVPLLRALRDARALVPPDVGLRAIVVGQGPERAAMERLLRREQMASWVELPGRYSREDLLELYRRADLFVSPAVLESFGIAALEARTAGLPVVAMAAAGTREFIRSGVEGLLAGDDRELAEQIAALVTHPDLRNRISAHNRRVTPEFTWPHVVERCDRAYARARTLVR